MIKHSQKLFKVGKGWDLGGNWTRRMAHGGNLSRAVKMTGDWIRNALTGTGKQVRQAVARPRGNNQGGEQ